MASVLLLFSTLIFSVAGYSWMEKFGLSNSITPSIYFSTSGSFYESSGRVTKQWELTAPANKQVVLTCSEVSFPMVKNCLQGGMTVWDGKSTKMVCGTSDELVLKSTGNRMRVKVSAAGNVKTRLSCSIAYSNPEDVATLAAEEEEIGPVPSQPQSTTCNCGWSNQRKRIVGGTETLPHEFVFMASLIVAGTKQRICGGSIVTESHVLSAAHCIDGDEVIPLVVGVGEHDITKKATNAAQYIDVIQQIPHESYNKKTVANDIAILQLAKKIKFNAYVGPVCLPTTNMNLVNQNIKAIGYGLTNKQVTVRGLRQVDLKVIDTYTCAETYYGLINTRRVTQLCTYMKDKDTCQGDSGGPLIYKDPTTNRFVQVALVSFGRECASASPAVNTDVYAYMDWIERTIQGTSQPLNVCKKV